MRKITKFKSLGLLIVLSGVLLLGACSPAAEDNENEVAGEQQQLIYGYIVSIDEQARAIMVDEFELVSKDDTKRIEVLGLDGEMDFGNQYYINNESLDMRSYSMADTTDFRISEYDYGTSVYFNRVWGTFGMSDADDGIETKDSAVIDDLKSKDFNALSSRLESHDHIPFAFIIRDGKIVEIEELVYIYN